jgi:hypothetical protein
MKRQGRKKKKPILYYLCPFSFYFSFSSFSCSAVRDLDEL